MRKQLSVMSTDDRVRLADEKMQRIADELRWLIDLHENNALVVYSPLLASQIPKSFAARAFGVVQGSMLYLEIVRLCALWDKPDMANFSIPTVVELADDDDFQRVLLNRMEPQFRDFPEQIGQREAENTVQRLREAIAAARYMEKSEKLRSAKNLRNKHLTHLLKQTREERKRAVAPSKHGDEKDLLEETIKIVDGLMLGIKGVDCGWQNSRRIASKNAQALWAGCKIEVLQ